MKDGLSPDDFRAKLFRDREHTGDWRVEKLCDDGESIDVAIFQRSRCRYVIPIASLGADTTRLWTAA
jgi:hypothetical protein